MSAGPVPRLLTVCLGNICRSPTAEAALREAAERAGVAVEVRSAGTGDWHVGEPPDARMRAAAADVGLDITGTAAQVDVDDLDAADLVLAMDRSNLAVLQRLATLGRLATPIRLFREFDPEAGDDLEVPDPYYGGPEGFAEVVQIARRTAREVIRHVASDAVDGSDAVEGSGAVEGSDAVDGSDAVEGTSHEEQA